MCHRCDWHQLSVMIASCIWLDWSSARETEVWMVSWDRPVPPVWTLMHTSPLKKNTKLTIKDGKTENNSLFINSPR